MAGNGGLLLGRHDEGGCWGCGGELIGKRGEAVRRGGWHAEDMRSGGCDLRSDLVRAVVTGDGCGGI